MNDTSAKGRPTRWVRERVGLVADGRPLLHRLGLASWSMIGVIALTAIVIYGLASISSLLLPLLFAMVFAVLFRPLVRRMEARRVPPSIAAGIVVAGLIGVCVGVVALTVMGVIDQSDRIGSEIEEAMRGLDIDQEDITEVRGRLEEMGSGMGSGFLSSFASGLSVVGEVIVGVLLGVMIFYYLLKDGPGLRAKLVARAPEGDAGRLDAFVSETFYVLRRYWLGRSIVSAVVATVVGVAALAMGLPLVVTIAVVTFIGGFIPYVGAIVGGALAVVIALGSSGVVAAIVMLGVVLVANVLIENLVEPAVTGRTLQIHPLLVLLATTCGATLGGIAGMIMAVPLAVIADRAIPLILDLLDDVPPEDDEPLPAATDGALDSASVDAALGDRDRHPEPAGIAGVESTHSSDE